MTNLKRFRGFGDKIISKRAQNIFLKDFQPETRQDRILIYNRRMITRNSVKKPVNFNVHEILNEINFIVPLVLLI